MNVVRHSPLLAMLQGALQPVRRGNPTRRKLHPTDWIEHGTHRSKPRRTCEENREPWTGARGAEEAQGRHAERGDRNGHTEGVSTAARLRNWTTNLCKFKRKLKSWRSNLPNHWRRGSRWLPIRRCRRSICTVSYSARQVGFLVQSRRQSLDLSDCSTRKYLTVGTMWSRMRLQRPLKRKENTNKLRGCEQTGGCWKGDSEIEVRSGRVFVAAPSGGCREGGEARPFPICNQKLGKI